MVLRRNVTVVVALCSIALPLGFDAFTRVACYGGYGWADLFILVPSLLIALGLIATSNPLRSVGAAVGFTAALAYAYHSECVRPYEGGGASFIGLIMFFAVPFCTGAGAWLAETLSMVLRIKVDNPEVAAPDAR
jgi:hypothetical protein